jgi:methylmalonyl-CoA/ethylmalonyl-CoA epimerase
MTGTHRGGDAAEEAVLEARPDTSTPFAVRRIDHVGIVVRDVDVAARYWVDRLGLRRAETADVLGGSIRMTYLEAGDTTLQLVEPRMPGPLRDHLDRHGEGLHHLCFLVGDIPDALERIGEQPLTEPYLGGRGAGVCFIRTMPCDVLVELTEPGPRGPGPHDDASLAALAPGIPVAAREVRDQGTAE